MIIKFPFYVKCFWHSFNLMDLIPDLDWTVESSKCWIGSRNGLLIARTGLTQNIWTGFWTVPNYACGQPKQCWTTGQSDCLGHDWLMMSSTNGGFERHKVGLILVDEFQGLYLD